MQGITWEDLENFKKARLTYREIGEMYGVSRQRIHQIWKAMAGRGKGWRPKLPRKFLCVRCGAVVEKDRPFSKYCKRCFHDIKALALAKMRREGWYHDALSKAKTRWWAERKVKKNAVHI